MSERAPLSERVERVPDHVFDIQAYVSSPVLPTLRPPAYS